MTENNTLRTTKIRDRVKTTSHFKKLSVIQQKLFLSSNNLKKVCHGIKLVQNLGQKRFEEITNYNYNAVEIIKELANE